MLSCGPCNESEVPFINGRVAPVSAADFLFVRRVIAHAAL